MTGLNSREIYIEYHASELSPNLCNVFFFSIALHNNDLLDREAFFQYHVSLVSLQVDPKPRSD